MQASHAATPGQDLTAILLAPLFQGESGTERFLSIPSEARSSLGGIMGLFDWLLHRLIDQIFNQVDYNNNGRLEAIEIEVAILKIYNIINRRLPGWQNPPTRAQIATALTVFDVDGNGTLDRSEFYLFTKDMVHSGPDTFFKRVGTSAVLRTALIPGVTHLLQKVARQSGQFGKFGNAPLAIMAPTMGVLGGALRGLIPM
ncbi:hypothetical protein CVIRNUC_010835 [Coccomyxa viridis]|uniref:EF-hand domain-containing protein n=1 Tax=Coccomyxa viridis TaxID=1274662 RepID=A0AAV1IK19_9CHLO|nr:hypothetical protein CVIRNUC_010835 [Coccomyxa viridis]